MENLPNGPYDNAPEEIRPSFYTERVRFYQPVAYQANPDGDDILVWQGEIYSDYWSDENLKYALAEGRNFIKTHPGFYMTVENAGSEWRANGPDPNDYPED